MATKLDQFLYSRRIKTVDVARSSGFSRQQVHGVRNGRIDPTRRCIAAIALACRSLSGEPVQAAELFELDVELALELELDMDIDLELGKEAQGGNEVSPAGGDYRNDTMDDSWSRR